MALDFLATGFSSHPLVVSASIIHRIISQIVDLFCIVKISLTDVSVSLPAEWRIQRPVRRRGPWQCPTEAWRDPRAPLVSCPSLPGLPSTGSTRPSHQGDDGRGRGRSDGGVVMNSCSGRSSAGGCQANTSTWSPLARRATQRKALLRGLTCRLPAGPPCHWLNSVAPDMR